MLWPKSSNILPRRAPLMNDKSLDSHLIPSALGSAMKQAPSMVECPEWRASWSAEHRKNLAVPFSENPFPSTSRADCNSIDFCPTSHREGSTLNGHAAIPKALEIHMNNELDYLYMLKRDKLDTKIHIKTHKFPFNFNFRANDSRKHIDSIKKQSTEKLYVCGWFMKNSCDIIYDAIIEHYW